jgi:hypothetical protein
MIAATVEMRPDAEERGGEGNWVKVAEREGGEALHAREELGADTEADTQSNRSVSDTASEYTYTLERAAYDDAHALQMRVSVALG